MQVITCLGLDPGVNLGWCVCQKVVELSKKDKYLYSELGKTEVEVVNFGLERLKGKTPGAKLFRMHVFLTEMFDRYGIDLLAWEAPPMVIHTSLKQRKTYNPKTFAQLQRYDGIARLQCELEHVIPLPINNKTIKKFATGSGNADKKAVRDSLPKLTGKLATYKGKPVPFDIADAICTCLCGLDRITRVEELNTELNILLGRFNGGSK